MTMDLCTTALLMSSLSFFLSLVLQTSTLSFFFSYPGFTNAYPFFFFLLWFYKRLPFFSWLYKRQPFHFFPWFCTSVISVSIVTGSQSVLRENQNGNIWHKWAPYVDCSRVRDLVCIYCPEHAGERADGLASTATVEVIITMDKGEIINKIYKPMLVDHTCAISKGRNERSAVQEGGWF